MSSTARSLVGFTDQTDLDPTAGRELLEQNGFDTVVLDLANNRLVPEPARRAVALVVGYADIDAEIFEQFPNVGIVATSSAGYDMIDTSVAAARGIWVSNVADSATRRGCRAYLVAGVGARTTVA